MSILDPNKIIYEEIVITSIVSDEDKPQKELIRSIVDFNEPNVPLKERQKSDVLGILQHVYMNGKMRYRMSATEWLNVLKKIEKVYTCSTAQK